MQKDALMPMTTGVGFAPTSPALAAVQARRGPPMP